MHAIILFDCLFAFLFVIEVCTYVFCRVGSAVA